MKNNSNNEQNALENLIWILIIIALIAQPSLFLIAFTVLSIFYGFILIVDYLRSLITINPSPDENNLLNSEEIIIENSQEVVTMGYVPKPIPVPDDLENILSDLSNGEIKDPVSQERFHPGETVYLCHRHRLAYHEDSWQELGNKCIQCSSKVHTKKYTIPSTCNIPLHLPLSINLHSLEQTEVTINDTKYSTQIIINNNLYDIVDRLTQLPVLSADSVENILDVQLLETTQNGNLIIYESSDDEQHPIFSGVRLRQSLNNPSESQLSLVISSNLRIPISDAIAYYGEDNLAIAYDNTVKDISNSFIKKIGNYKVAFRIYIALGTNIAAIAIYPVRTDQ